MVKHFASFLLAFSFAAACAAQQQPTSGYPDSTQSPTSVDCPDPLQADSIQCANQNAQNPGTTLPLSGNQQLKPEQGLPSDQSRLTRSYSDAESQARQATGQRRAQQLSLPPEPLTEFKSLPPPQPARFFPSMGKSFQECSFNIRATGHGAGPSQITSSDRGTSFAFKSGDR